MSRNLEFVAIALLISLPVTAQRTWIVDQANGPGTDFVDLPPAVLAAAPHDTIVVRHGRYRRTTISIPLTILGEPASSPWSTAASKVSWLTISGIPAGERVVLAQLTFDSFFGARDNPGAIHLDQVAVSSCTIEQSADVTLTEVRSWEHPVALLDCANVSIVGGDFGPSVWASYSGPGLRLVRSSAAMSGASVGGSSGVFAPWGKTYAHPAVDMEASTLRIGGDSMLVGGRYSVLPGGPFGQLPAVSGSGIVRVDPAVSLTTHGVNVAEEPTPALVATGSPIGSAQQIRAWFPQSSSVVLFASVPPAAAIQFGPHVVWLDLPTTVTVGAGTYPQATFADFSTGPLVGFPRGLALSYQAALLDPAGALLVSLRAVTIAW